MTLLIANRNPLLRSRLAIGYKTCSIERIHTFQLCMLCHVAIIRLLWIMLQWVKRSYLSAKARERHYLERLHIMKLSTVLKGSHYLRESVYYIGITDAIHVFLKVSHNLHQWYQIYFEASDSDVCMCLYFNYLLITQIAEYLFI